jgi:hypothetical protein
LLQANPTKKGKRKPWSRCFESEDEEYREEVVKRRKQTKPNKKVEVSVFFSTSLNLSGGSGI